MDVEITVDASSVKVRSPYNEDFIYSAKEIGGKYRARVWQFDRRDEERVRELCMKWYGTDGRESDLVTVRVEFDGNTSACGSSITLCGRPIARATGRDSGAKLCEGVILLEGGFLSGGSLKNWTTCTGLRGATVLVRDFPRATAERLIAEKAKVRIEEEGQLDVPGLQRERDRLMERLDEISRLLKADGAQLDAGSFGARQVPCAGATEAGAVSPA